MQSSESSSPTGQTASVSGYVTSAKTGERLAAANISLSYGKQGTSTDADGFYQLDAISPGTYTLISSYIGYRRYKQEVQIEPGEHLHINIPLKLEPYELEEVVVETSKDGKWKRSIGMATVDPSTITSLPSVFQADLFRSLQLLPGVVSMSDFSSGLYVRGGSPDQTLIQLDGAPVYNPSHFFGFYSTFNPDAISDVRLHKGNYPAEYGGRLGSVLSISNKQGDREEFGGSVSLGMLAASASANGPLPDHKGSWMFSIRRSTLEPMLGMMKHSIEDIPEDFYLLDLNGRMNLDIDTRNRISLSVYSGKDHLEFPFARDAGINLDYGNQVISSSWQHIFSDKVFTTFNVSGSRYFNYPTFDAASTVYRRTNTISDLSFSSDTEYLVNETHQLEMGFDLGKRKLRLQDEYDSNSTFDSEVRLLDASVYVKDQWALSDEVEFKPGLRLNHGGNELQVEPRMSLEYRPVETVRLQGAVGRYSQDLTLISNESFTGMDVWLAANDNVPASTGQQYGVGVKINSPSRSERSQRVEKSPRHPQQGGRRERSQGMSGNQPPSSYAINIELYYRTMNNLFEPDPLLMDQAGVPYRDLFRFGEGYAQGVEVSLERNAGDLTGYMGYTLSNTQRRFPEVSDDYYNTRFDRKHNLNVMMEYEISNAWAVNGVFSYTSGQPYTEIVGRMPYFDSSLNVRGKLQLIPGEKNASQMPSYHRLDLGLVRKGSFFDLGDSKLNLQLLNVYSRRNVWFYTYDLTKGSDYQDEVQLLPLLPGISYSIYF